MNKGLIRVPRVRGNEKNVTGETGLFGRRWTRVTGAVDFESTEGDALVARS